MLWLLCHKIPNGFLPLACEETLCPTLSHPCLPILPGTVQLEQLQALPLALPWPCVTALAFPTWQRMGVCLYILETNQLKSFPREDMKTSYSHSN